MKPPKKFQTFFYKRHFTSLVEIIWGEPTACFSKQRRPRSMDQRRGDRKGGKKLFWRNGTSRVKKCRFSLNEGMG